MEQPWWEMLRCPRHAGSGRLHVRHANSQGDPGANGVAGLECVACGTVYPVTVGIIDMLEPLPDAGAMEFLQAESRQWDNHAPRYNEARSKDLTYMSCIRAGLRALGARPAERVLDAGCGTGMGTRFLLDAGVSTVPLDLSVASLRQLNGELAQSLPCVRADISRLPFADGTFDRLICANTLQHVPDAEARRQCIAEFSRVVRPGGTVVVTAHGYSVSKQRAGWNKEGSAPMGYGTSDRVQYIYRYEAQEFRDLLTRHLHVQAVTGAGFPLPYRFKLSPLSRLLERVLSRLESGAPWGHILVGKCIVR